jgi:hypothetical protein
MLMRISQALQPHTKTCSQDERTAEQCLCMEENPNGSVSVQHSKGLYRTHRLLRQRQDGWVALRSHPVKQLPCRSESIRSVRPGEMD